MSSEPVFWDCYYQNQTNIPGAPRVIKSSANEKERGRVQTVNTAFTTLRTMIPTDPIDRKLSKVETLRLAASYISHLSSVLMVGSTDNQPCSRQRNRPNRTVCTFCISGLKNRSKRKDFTDRKMTHYGPNDSDTTLLLPQNNDISHTCGNHRNYGNFQERVGSYGNGENLSEDWFGYAAANPSMAAQWLAVQDSIVADDVMT